MQFKHSTTIEREDCRQILNPRGPGAMVHPNKLCTISPVGFGTCHGDSGGPLVDDRGILVGLVSFGRPCATRKPDVYERVYTHLDFIQSRTGAIPRKL